MLVPSDLRAIPKLPIESRRATGSRGAADHSPPNERHEAVAHLSAVLVISSKFTNQRLFFLPNSQNENGIEAQHGHEVPEVLLGHDCASLLWNSLVRARLLVPQGRGLPCCVRLRRAAG